MNIPESDKKSPKLTRLNKQSNECVEMTKIPTFVHQKSLFFALFLCFFFFSIFRIFLISFLNPQPAAPSSHVERGWPHCIVKLKSYHVTIAEGLLSRGTSHQPRSSDHTGCQRVVVHVRLYQALNLLLDLYVHSA